MPNPQVQECFGIPRHSFPSRSVLYLNTANTQGTINTCIMRFSNIVEAYGSAFDYHDDLRFGGLVTIMVDGIYCISTGAVNSAGGNIGISRNSTQLTTSILSINAINRIAYADTPATATTAVATYTGPLKAGDLIRAHYDTGSYGTNAGRTYLMCTQLSL